MNSINLRKPLLLTATLKRRILSAIQSPAHYLYSSELVTSLKATEGSLQLAAEELEKEHGIHRVLSDIPEAAFCVGAGHKYAVNVEAFNTQHFRAREVLEALYKFHEHSDEEWMSFSGLKEELWVRG